MGIDENVCPATYEIDYVRVYQWVKTDRPALDAQADRPSPLRLRWHGTG